MAGVSIASQKGRPVCGRSVLQIGPSHMGRLAMIVTLSRANPLYCYTQSVIIHDLFFITPKYARSGQLGQRRMCEVRMVFGESAKFYHIRMLPQAAPHFHDLLCEFTRTRFCILPRKTGSMGRNAAYTGAGQWPVWPVLPRRVPSLQTL